MSLAISFVLCDVADRKRILCISFVAVVTVMYSMLTQGKFNEKILQDFQSFMALNGRSKLTKLKQKKAKPIIYHNSGEEKFFA